MDKIKPNIGGVVENFRGINAPLCLQRIQIVLCSRYISLFHFNWNVCILWFEIFKWTIWQLKYMLKHTYSCLCMCVSVYIWFPFFAYFFFSLFFSFSTCMFLRFVVCNREQKKPFLTTFIFVLNDEMVGIGNKQKKIMPKTNTYAHTLVTAVCSF